MHWIIKEPESTRRNLTFADEIHFKHEAYKAVDHTVLLLILRQQMSNYVLQFLFPMVILFK